MPLLAGLFFAALAGPSFSAVSRINLQAVLAALQDPLSLFAQRSPGKRQSGKLHPTKSIKGKPHERVLASVRDRPAAPPLASPGDVPGSSVTIPIIPPQYEVPPEGPLTTGTPPFPLPPIPYVPIDNPGPPIIPPVPPPGSPVPPPGTPTPPPGTPTPPPGTPTPPPGTPTPPPGTPTPPPETPPGIIVTVPEPASWTMMILGVLALGVARRRLRKRVAVRWRSHV